MNKDTRQRIVYAAMELFWLKGYASTSIADILSRSQVNSGSLYYFFPGKQDVLIAVLEAYRDGIGRCCWSRRGAAWRTRSRRSSRCWRQYRRAIVDTECEYGCPIGSLALELHEPDPAVRELLAANFTAWVAAVEACFREAADRFEPGHGLPRARRVDAQRHGRRRHAGADLSRRRLFRSRRRAVAH